MPLYAIDDAYRLPRCDAAYALRAAIDAADGTRYAAFSCRQI